MKIDWSFDVLSVKTGHIHCWYINLLKLCKFTQMVNERIQFKFQVDIQFKFQVDGCMHLWYDGWQSIWAVCKNLQKRCFIQISNTIMLLMKMNHCLVMLMMSLNSFFLINAGNNASMKKTLMGVCILDKVDKVGGLFHFNQISHDYKRRILEKKQDLGG